MRLLIIDPGLSLWGSERALLATLPSLVAAHERVVLLVPTGAELGDAARASGVLVERAPIGNLHKSGHWSRPLAVSAITAACIRHRIDTVYLNQAGLCRLVTPIARMLRRRLVIHVRLIEDIARCAAIPATSSAPVDLIFVSHDMRQRYPLGRPLEANKRLITAYDPFELSGQPPSSKNRPRDFVCVGRISASKGHGLLVEAVACNRDRGTSIDVDILGVGVPGDPFEAQLRARVETLGLSDHIHFLGFQHDVPARMHGYRYLIAPSTYESLGRVVMEAWDGGVAPIANAASGGAAEMIQACGGGLLYARQDVASLAEQLRAAATLPEPSRQDLVARGRDWAQRNLSVAGYVETLAGILFPSVDAAVVVRSARATQELGHPS